VSHSAHAAVRGTGSPDSIDDAVAKMREHGRRITTARRLLLGALLTKPGHRSAEELAADVRARAPAVNITTIYRNLDDLERLKIIDRTRLGPATYHLASAAHGHLLCDKCGSMTEVPDKLFTGLARKAREGYGFTVDPHQFAVIGLCASCLSVNFVQQEVQQPMRTTATLRWHRHTYRAALFDRDQDRADSLHPDSLATLAALGPPKDAQRCRPASGAIRPVASTAAHLLGG
jgi:Fur family transcriptional regulator, ferric uptake regulator